MTDPFYLYYRNKFYALIVYNSTCLTTSKKILSLLLILVLSLHTNYLALYYSLYELNTEALTASCCEKKEVNCNAHCYLDKKMNDQESKNSKGISSDIKLKITEYIVSDYLPELTPDKLIKFYSYLNHFNLNETISDIDHPPQS